MDKATRVLNDRRTDEIKSKKTCHSCAKENERVQELMVDVKGGKSKMLSDKDFSKVNIRQQNGIGGRFGMALQCPFFFAVGEQEEEGGGGDEEGRHGLLQLHDEGGACQAGMGVRRVPRMRRLPEPGARAADQHERRSQQAQPSHIHDRSQNGPGNVFRIYTVYHLISFMT